MPAVTSPRATQEFADLLYRLVDEAGADVTIDDAAEIGWMIRHGEAVEITDHDSGRTWLARVQVVSTV